MQLPKKAIITLAGLGTRFLPATKAQPKEMLPLIDKPIVQYVVEEMAAAGARDIIMVTKKGGHTIEDHFDSNFELEEQLKRTGKRDRLKAVIDISKIANFIYLRQKAYMPYGNGTPLRVAADLISDGPFFYAFGDMLAQSKTPVAQQLLKIYQKNPEAAAIVAAYPVARKLVSRYGIFKIKSGTKNELERVVEKPKPRQSPSNLMNAGRFLFTAKILPIIRKMKTGKDNELWLVDAIQILVDQGEKVIVQACEGKVCDTGDPLNYLKTTFDFAWERADLRQELRKYIVEKLKE